MSFCLCLWSIYKPCVKVIVWLCSECFGTIFYFLCHSLITMNKTTPLLSWCHHDPCRHQISNCCWTLLWNAFGRGCSLQQDLSSSCTYLSPRDFTVALKAFLFYFQSDIWSRLSLPSAIWKPDTIFLSKVIIFIKQHAFPFLFYN